MKNVSRVKEQSSTAGLSSYELASSGALYRRFRDEFASGERVRYVVSSAADFEEGLGVLTYGTPDTLSRDTIIRSSTGAKINWPAGTRDIFVAPLPGTAPVQDKSATYTATMQDHGSLIRFTGTTATLNLLAAASAGDGFSIEVRNDGTGDVTIDPSGSEQINGATTAVVKPGSSGFLRCSGTAWWAVGFSSLDISGLTEDTEPDPQSDFAPTYDASATGNKKAKLKNFGRLVQRVDDEDAAHATSTATMPTGDTAPINTDGAEVLSLSITPRSSSNTVLLSATVIVGCGSVRDFVVTLLRGTTVIAAAKQYVNGIATISFAVEDAPATTSATTYSVRAGVTAGATWSLNGDGSTRVLGGKVISSLAAMECAP